MKYAALAFILVSSLYTLSYIKYNWNKKNRLGAIGVLILMVCSIALPVFTMFFR